MALKPPNVYFATSGGVAYGITAATGINFGTVIAGQSSSEITLYLKNDDLYLSLIATEIDCVIHPFGLQAGAAADTYNAVEFALTSGGPYTINAPLAFGTVWFDFLNGPFYAKWFVPADAVKGSKVWGIMVSGNYE